MTWTARNAAGATVTATQTVTAILGDEPSCCPAGTNVILGNSTAEVLTGTAAADCILGRGGNDIIVGLGGNDLISGGSGDDILRGDEGNDLIFGGPGKDTLVGVFGRDTLQGGEGDDQLDGGDDNDRLFGEPGNDQLNGGRGNDLLDGRAEGTNASRAEARTRFAPARWCPVPSRAALVLGGILAAPLLAAEGPAPVKFVDEAVEAGVLLRNVSGSAEKRHIIETSGAGACFLDYDLDGDLDLYMVNGATLETLGKPGAARDALYRNDGERRFADVSVEAGIASERGWGGGRTTTTLTWTSS